MIPSEFSCSTTVKEITLKIKKVTVLQRAGHTDKIFISVDLPTAFPEMQHPASFSTEARIGHGVEWCREALGIEPEVISA